MDKLLDEIESYWSTRTEGYSEVNEKELKGMQKLITTPCEILADEGNSLGLLETEFLTWNEFLRRIGESFPSARRFFTFGSRLINSRSMPKQRTSAINDASSSRLSQG